MDCAEVYRFLIEELDEHLDEPSRRSIKEHLSSCGNCATTLQYLKKTVSLYKSQPSLIVPQSLLSHVLEVIKSSRAKPSE